MKDKDKEKGTVLRAAPASPVDEGRREHVRTSDHIPVYYEQWSESAQQKSELDWEVLFNEIEPSPEENPRLYELLFDINQKLNMLIRHMSDKNGFNVPEARDVNISGGGLRFFCSDFFKEGEKLILKTFLPTFAHAIKIRCEVVRSLPTGAGGYEVAVKYINMDEGTREKIIKYIFAKQRKLLRHDKADEKA